MTYLIYKCKFCGAKFHGAESDLGASEVVSGMQEGWYDMQRLHVCVEGKEFGIADLVGVKVE